MALQEGFHCINFFDNIQYIEVKAKIGMILRREYNFIKDWNVRYKNITSINHFEIKCKTPLWVCEFGVLNTENAIHLFTNIRTF